MKKGKKLVARSRGHVTRFKREIKKTTMKPVLKVSSPEREALDIILKENPLYFPGLSREIPSLYRAVTGLRGKGLAVKEGYRYYPTRHSYLLPKKKQLRLDRLPKPERSAPWNHILSPQKRTGLLGKQPKRKRAPGRYVRNWATGKLIKLPRRKCDHGVKGLICTIQEGDPVICKECLRIHGIGQVILSERR